MLLDPLVWIKLNKQTGLTRLGIGYNMYENGQFKNLPQSVDKHRNFKAKIVPAVTEIRFDKAKKFQMAVMKLRLETCGGNLAIRGNSEFKKLLRRRQRERHNCNGD